MKLFSGHLRGVLTFTGRENREPFWLWILICYLAQIFLYMVAAIPLWLRIAQQMQQGMASGHPERMRDPQVMFHDMQPMMQSLGAVSFVIGLAFIVLIAAAAVRRLHDSDRTGWWIVPPLLLRIASQIAGLAILMRGNLFADAGRKPFGAVTAAGPIQFLALLALVAIVVMLVLPGTPGENRFGPDPLGG